MLQFDEFRAAGKRWDLTDVNTLRNPDFWSYYTPDLLVEASGLICANGNKAFHLYRASAEGCENGWTVIERDDGYFDAMQGGRLGSTLHEAEEEIYRCYSEWAEIGEEAWETL